MKIKYLILSLSIILFSPSLFNFFSSDDWFHLRIAQINNFWEFLNFFSFHLNNQSAAFYRPISTQFFFFIFQTLFGLNSLIYHVFVLTIFGVSLILVYKISEIFFKKNFQKFFFLSIYSFSATNFTRLYFLSAFQEILMLVFVLISILFYLKPNNLKNSLVSIIFFVLALGSKETAVILPFCLIMIDFCFKRINYRKVAPFIVIAIVYLILRIFVFGLVKGDSYIFDLSLRKVVNTLMWYSLWSLGTPELLVDYISSGFKIVPRFFEIFPFWSKLMLGALGINLLILFTNIILNIKKFSGNRSLYVGIVLFLVSLSPVLFFPWHKFTLELTLPMVWVSLMLTIIFTSSGKYWISKIFLGGFLTLNILTIVFTYQTNPVVTRAKISENIHLFFKQNYPQPIRGRYFEFTNNTKSSSIWGESKQISQSLSGSEFFKVFYKDRNFQVYYQDLDRFLPEESKMIKLGSLQYIR